MSDPIVHLEGIRKTYGRGTATSLVLAGIDLDIERGEYVSLMGPSGSGKSTLLNIIAGLDAPESGRVLVAGQDLRAQSDAQLAHLRLHTIGFVFQSFNLLPALTVEENVAWPLAFAGVSRAEARRRTAEVLARVGVADSAPRFPSELSGGEQQRVAIARALAGRPSLILADEPTGNLDSHTGRAILDLLTELNASQSVTVVMVTHSVFAATYGHRTIELQDGRIVRDVQAPRPAPSRLRAIQGH